MSSFLFVLSFFYFFSAAKKNIMETKGSVKGILKDKHGMPVADAAVMITGGTHEFTDIASISNGQGEFFVSGIVIPGTYTLQIQLTDSSITKSIQVQSADTVLQINL